MILALDTSSTAVGVALFHQDGRDADRTFRLTPNYSGAACPVKINMLCDEIKGYIAEVSAEFGPVTIIVIEKAPTFQKNGSIAPQNQAYGAINHLLHTLGIRRVYEIGIGEWTKGRSKENRQWHIRQTLGLSESDDKGGDALDALMLGKWWIAQNKHRLTEHAKLIEEAKGEKR